VSRLQSCDNTVVHQEHEARIVVCDPGVGFVGMVIDVPSLSYNYGSAGLDLISSWDALSAGAAIDFEKMLSTCCRGDNGGG
jgi:hypothetical protein